MGPPPLARELFSVSVSLIITSTAFEVYFVNGLGHAGRCNVYSFFLCIRVVVVVLLYLKMYVSCDVVVCKPVESAFGFEVAYLYLEVVVVKLCAWFLTHSCPHANQCLTNVCGLCVDYMWEPSYSRYVIVTANVFKSWYGTS